MARKNNSYVSIMSDSNTENEVNVNEVVSDNDITPNN
jgi:hypothetical protein